MYSKNVVNSKQVVNLIEEQNKANELLYQEVYHFDFIQPGLSLNHILGIPPWNAVFTRDVLTSLGTSEKTRKCIS